MLTLRPDGVRPQAVVPCILAVAGIMMSASESPAAAHERHAAGAKAMWHQARAAHAGVHGAALHRSQQAAGGAGHRFPLHAAHREVAHGGEHSFSGFASYYSEGQRLASGGRFNPSGLTCAHRSLPFGTHLQVADPKSGRSVVVTVNDRGPFVHGRVLDLSLGAARALGMTGRGVMRIEARVI
jgi:rare lipoprotein A